MRAPLISHHQNEDLLTHEANYASFPALFWSNYILCGRHHCPNELMANRDWSVIGSANNEVIIRTQVAEQGFYTQQIDEQ